MKYSILLLLSFLIWSCDDPSLDDPNSGIDEVIEPVLDARLLSTIQVALDNPSNITRDITFDYNANNLLTTITETGNIDQITQASYGNGNQLQVLSISENMQPDTDVAVSYGNDTNVTATSIVVLNYTDDAGIPFEKTLYIDNQNRFDKVITTQTDLSGVTTQVENLELEYTQNFNVLRINKFDATGLIIGYSDFTYNFNNNPFTDMNDIIRLFMFDEFVPYSRYLPATRLDYDISGGSTVLERSIDYSYVLDAEGYPMSRELITTEGLITSLSFEFFNYRP
ncbi:MAG: hypothetical protein ACSHWW_02240 [Nonlabens sp.]|uniref:hypothetical protein n=1 Tax=Nonlabens sp. TaxID=1888209 RepID=UPI003EF20D70